uniref:EF-hand domain-containing protein n=1 Tax=Neogobius melanostomus TaxID=47308 RepID=A0A8C6SAJ0_9GOBI
MSDCCGVPVSARSFGSSNLKLSYFITMASSTVLENKSVFVYSILPCPYQINERNVSMLFQNVKDPAKLDELMKELDDDGDGQVDFLEFVGLVAGLACVCNDFIELIVTLSECTSKV